MMAELMTTAKRIPAFMLHLLLPSGGHKRGRELGGKVRAVWPGAGIGSRAVKKDREHTIVSLGLSSILCGMSRHPVA